MLAPTVDRTNRVQVSSPPALLSSELEFYQSYAWCLNPHLTVSNALQHLRDEIEKLSLHLCSWQVEEVATNVLLLSCAVLNSVDEYLRGPALKMPGRLVTTRLGRVATRATEEIAGIRFTHRTILDHWRDRWLTSLDHFSSRLVPGRVADPNALAEAAGRFTPLSQSWLPPGLKAEVISVPSPFRRLDLTHFDVFTLGERFERRFPDRSRSILLIGLRTSGTYFAPLLRAFLRSRGFRTVALMTMQPEKGPGRRECQELRSCARLGFTAVILDDPPQSGDTVLRALETARHAGFPSGKVIALIPVHPTRRNCFGALADSLVISCPPEQWHKHRILNSQKAQERLLEYFRHRNFQHVEVVQSRRAKEFELRSARLSSNGRGARLKRVYEVHLETSERKETRYVLAKSVGWGWLGYHALLVGHRLTGLVPDVLGLRDGILYMEWVPQASPLADRTVDRAELLDASADYVAARVRRLPLNVTTSRRHPQRHENAIRLLAKVCSQAYGRLVTDQMMRPRVLQWLTNLHCPCPTLIDGKMEPDEWIVGSGRMLKTDFEHHGMGKGELNFADPALDIAQTVLELELSRGEEEDFIRRYIEASEDTDVESRLFMSKLLAGIWAMDIVQQHLFDKARGPAKQRDLHRRYVSAWNFLIVHTARACGRLCHPSVEIAWRSPLVALDIDGVIDRKIFGFPCTTAAGIEALRLLQGHGFAVVLNTARAAMEVKEYCRAYSLAGGVAEHGSYLWDAVSQREEVMVGSEAIRQLDELRRYLQQIPGVFVDERHHFSIRAWTYIKAPRGLSASLSMSARPYVIGGGASTPLSTLLMNHLLTDLGLDGLSFHHTTIDTTVIAKDIDKGTGLTALRDWVLDPNACTLAVGDSESDLPMFRAATYSFAPAHIDCARQARLLGCRITRHPYQRGLLEIVRSLIHPDGRRCERCEDITSSVGNGQEPLLLFLQAADRSVGANFVRAVFGRQAFRAFLR